MLKSADGDDHRDRIHDHDTSLDVNRNNGSSPPSSSSASQSASPFRLRDLKESFGTSRTNDDVHRSIQLCPLTIAVLDTPHMQRLRGLKQLGVSEMTYVPTTHSRFEHSLGVATLAEKVLREIARNQPNLKITEKDIVCVKLAGLLHDIGHGPYSHVYDGTFRRELKKAEEHRVWLGYSFRKEVYDGLPEVMDGWEHEDGSLMMIDALLRHLGLEIDETRLDEPLRQVGDGIRAESFGIHETVPVTVTETLPLGNEKDDHEYGMNGHPNGNGNVNANTNNNGNTGAFQQKINPLTSRDWIFIKECIVAGPLPPKGMSVDHAKKAWYSNPSQRPTFIGRPSIYKEFLYDVVANRHSGLDVDKMDYLARDNRRSFASGEIDPMFIENAHVAWGACGRPLKCFRCKYLHGGTNGNVNVKVSSSLSPLPEEEDHGNGNDNDCHGDKKNREGQHLMICYPEKMVQNAMNFFKCRFANHQKLYTHHNTNAACFMVCDIMLLADPYFRISTKDEGDGTLPPRKVGETIWNGERGKGEIHGQGRDATAADVPLKLPISRANVHPQSYLLLKDSILDLIAATDSDELRPARKLINRFRSHKLYKKVAEQPIVSKNGRDVDEPWQRALWDMSESDIAMTIVKCAQLRGGPGQQHGLQVEHIIVEKREIHHGMKADNPVSAMRFLPKSQLSKLREAPENLPTAVEIDEKTYECSAPCAFLQRTLRVYCRKYDPDVCEFLQTCYYQFIENVKKRSSNGNNGGDVHVRMRGEDRDVQMLLVAQPNVLSQSPARCSNDSFAVGNGNGNSSNHYEPEEGGSRKRRKPLFSNIDLDLH